MIDRPNFWPEAGMRWGPPNKDQLNQDGEREKVLSSLRDGREVGQVLEDIESFVLTPEQKEKLSCYVRELSLFFQDNDRLPQIRQSREDGTNLKDMGARTVRGRTAGVPRRSRRLVYNLKRVYQR